MKYSTNEISYHIEKTAKARRPDLRRTDSIPEKWDVTSKLFTNSISNLHVKQHSAILTDIK